MEKHYLSKHRPMNFFLCGIFSVGRFSKTCIYCNADALNDRQYPGFCVAFMGDRGTINKKVVGPI